MNKVTTHVALQKTASLTLLLKTANLCTKISCDLLTPRSIEKDSTATAHRLYRRWIRRRSQVPRTTSETELAVQEVNNNSIMLPYMARTSIKWVTSATVVLNIESSSGCGRYIAHTFETTIY